MEGWILVYSSTHS